MAAAVSVRLTLERARLELAKGFRSIVCSCGCGASYDAKTFAALPFVGMQDDFDGGWLELRNCTNFSTALGRPCQSTIARRA